MFLRLATLSHFKRETDVLQCCCHSATNSTSWSCVKIHEKTQQESYCIVNVWKKATDSAKQTPLKNYRIRASIIQINIDFPPSVELVHVWCLLLSGVVAAVWCGLSVVWLGKKCCCTSMKCVDKSEFYMGALSGELTYSKQHELLKQLRCAAWGGRWRFN